MAQDDIMVVFGMGIAPMHLSRFTTLWALKLLLGVAIFALAVWYVVFQARLLIEGPQVTLTYPTEILQNDRMITLRGNTANITNLTLNGRPIHTNEKGFFEESIVLPDGYSIVTIEAKDRYGREKTITHDFVYTNPSS